MHRRDFHACCAVTAAAFGTRNLLAADARPADDKEWGHLTAKFIYDGEPPERKRLTIDKDVDVYKDPVFDESLVVDPNSRGIANVAVWLYLGKDDPSPAIHSSYDESATEEIAVECLKGNITRRITPLRTSQTLLIRNTEAIGHNFKFDSNRNSVFCDLLPAGGSTKSRLTKAESRPVAAGCNIHPWESGWILVRDNPYMAVSDGSGQLRIKQLPVGKHTFVLWHELAGYIREVKHDGKAAKFDHGRLTVEIKPGENDLGEFLFIPKRGK